jgi:hypothetical protein
MMTKNLLELYEKSVASQLKVWDDEIEHLDSQADLRVAQIEDKYISLIKRLRQDETEIKTQLAALKETEEGDRRQEAVKVRIACAADKLTFDLMRATEEIVSRRM